MLKNKKQLLGLAGLVAVGIMTAIAYTVPAPDAAAIESAPGYECDNSIEGKECANTGNDVNINVVVSEPTSSAIIATPKDNSFTVDPIIGISTNYSQVTSIEYELYYNGKDGNETPKLIYSTTFNPTDESGMHAFNVDLADYAEGYGQYTLKTKGASINGAKPYEDTATFNYEAIIASVNPTPAENGDPIIDIEAGKAVDKVIVYIYDEKGNPIKDKDGNDLAIEVNVSDIDPNTGKVNVKVPFEENGLPGGNYTAVVAAQDEDGEILSLITLPLTYKPVTPDTPNTGFVLGDLNITRLDYILTGLLAFGLVAGFALYLIFRKDRRS